MVCFLFDFFGSDQCLFVKNVGLYQKHPNIHDYIPRFAEVAFLKHTIAVLLVFCELRSIIYFILKKYLAFL